MVREGIGLGMLAGWDRGVHRDCGPSLVVYVIPWMGLVRLSMECLCYGYVSFGGIDRSVERG